jgi:hypothetical protein
MALMEADMYKVLVLLNAIVCFSLPIKAEVFKCKLKSGKVIYQSESCNANQASQTVINIKAMTPEETAAASARLEEWQHQQAQEDAIKAAEAKQQQLEFERQESLELQRRSVMAQEQQAIAAQQQQNNSYAGGGLLCPPGSFNCRYPYSSPYPYVNGYPRQPYGYPAPTNITRPMPMHPPNNPPIQQETHRSAGISIIPYRGSTQPSFGSNR